MNLDILFIDSVCYKPYTPETLEKEALGGTEATAIRVVEKLASLGLSVGLIQHNLSMELTYKAYYLPQEYLSKVNTRLVVNIRSLTNFNLFPYANKFLWLHDLAEPKIRNWRNYLIQDQITTIGVSKWHRGDLRQSLCETEALINPKVNFIYNPLDEALNIDKDKIIDYKNNKLVWLSSPHKGLDKAIHLFSRIQEVSRNEYELHVYNPGYLFRDFKDLPKGIVLHGPKPCKQVWQETQDALCVFYPNTFNETFGLVASEANALHIPIMTVEKAGLMESVSTPNQFVRFNSKESEEESWYNKLIDWSKNGNRPKVYANKKFHINEVAEKWMQVLLKS